MTIYIFIKRVTVVILTLLMLVLIIFYSFSLNLINKYSRMDFSDINTRLIEPNTGWDVYTQKNLNELIDRIGYYQPTYLPNNFVKNYDTANNTFSIMTVYMDITL